MQSRSPKLNFPAAADIGAGQRLREDFAALGAKELAFANTAEGQALLGCLGGNAPYLAELACMEPDCLLRVMTDGPDEMLETLIRELREISPMAARAITASALRRAKRRAALAIAIADLGGIWGLVQITGALSKLAEAAVRVAVRHLLSGLHNAGQIALTHPTDPEYGSGFTVLALGKLGARELNYSSDIDLVLLFDPDAPVYSPEAQPIMARLARDLVTLLSHRDAEGYAFRVDLRLRPDPSATPPVVALPTALRYYESHGRSWERAAFSKARPIAGDVGLGAGFLAAIRPFIWRKHLDFAAIDDIYEMKRQIDSRHSADGLLGRDVKLGRGGIREVEFIVQTLSLVWGGQDAQLRIPATLDALPALVKTGHLPAATARELGNDYRELRRVEHRLQMVADRQTHTLPASQEALDVFAIFLGDADFFEEFPKLLDRVHRHFQGFFQTADAAQRIDPGQDGPPPAQFSAQLAAFGLHDIQHIAERLRAWAGGTMPALRSDRARELLDEILPHLLEQLGQQPEPDKAFALFDTLLARQQAGVQLLSLFQRNPALLRRLTAVLGAAPALAEHLAQDAQALEALLVPTARFAAPKSTLRRMLRDAPDLEQAVALTRHFVRREEFHLSVATLEGRLDANAAGFARANLAMAAIEILLPPVIRQHRARYSRVPGAAFAVVALGKAGSGEMLAGSDLDLMMIYDHAAMQPAPTPYFVRLSHALTGALTAQGREGPLYKVDMRLRPSGNAGPVAVSLSAFRRYHSEQSWTWERLALTRARVLAATPGFAAVVRREIATALARPDAGFKIRQDTVAMRDRLAAEMPPRGPFDVKALSGGMMELAFIAEALQLVHGPANPSVFQPNTADALGALATAGHVAPQDAEALVRADFLWRSVQGINRITGLRESEPDPAQAMLAPLLRATGAPELAALRNAMAEASRAVRQCFENYIEKGISP